MKIMKSREIDGWIGFFSKDEDGFYEEFSSVKTIDKAQRILYKLQRDINRLKKETRK